MRERISFASLWIVFVIIIAAIYLAKSLVDWNAWAFLFLIFVILSIILFKKTEVGLYLILFSVFFADWFKGLGFIPPHFTWIPEVVLIILAAKALYLIARRQGVIRSPVDIPITLFIIVGVFSSFVNDRNLLTAMLAFRIDLKFLLMFLILANTDLTERVYKKLLNVMIFLLVIQIPVAFIKYLKYGQWEGSIGTYSTFGGGLSTSLPLIASSIFIGFYFFKKANFNYMAYIIGFAIFAILAGKRGFFYYFIILSAFTFYILLKEKKITLKKGIVTILIIFSSLLLSLNFVPTLKRGVLNPSYLIDWAIEYQTNRLSTGEAIGRFSATKVSFSFLTKDILNFIVGFGPGSMMDTYFKEYENKIDVPIYYGDTNIVITSLEYGYLGLILYFIPIIILMIKNIKFFNKVKDTYWKSISFGFIGISITTLLLSTTYHCFFRIDLSAFIFWIIAASIFSVGNQKQIF